MKISQAIHDKLKHLPRPPIYYDSKDARAYRAGYTHALEDAERIARHAERLADPSGFPDWKDFNGANNPVVKRGHW